MPELTLRASPPPHQVAGAALPITSTSRFSPWGLGPLLLRVRRSPTPHFSKRAVSAGCYLGATSSDVCRVSATAIITQRAQRRTRRPYPLSKPSILPPIHWSGFQLRRAFFLTRRDFQASGQQSCGKNKVAQGRSANAVRLRLRRNNRHGGNGPYPLLEVHEPALIAAAFSRRFR